MEPVQAKVKVTKDELSQLKNWKSTMEKKLEERVKQRTEEMKKVLEGKDKKIKGLEGQLHQAKEEAIREYRNSDALLLELGSSFLEGFNDALCQVREAHLDLDLSLVKIKDPAQASVVPVALENTKELFAGGAPLVDGESAQNVQHVQSIVDEAY